MDHILLSYFWMVFVALLYLVQSGYGEITESSSLTDTMLSMPNVNELLSKATFPMVNKFFLDDYQQYYNLYHQTADYKRNKEAYSQLKKDIHNMVADLFICKSDKLEENMEMHYAHIRYLSRHSTSLTEMFTALYVKYLALQHSFSFMHCLGYGIKHVNAGLFYACTDVAYYLLWFCNINAFQLIEHISKTLEPIMDRHDWIYIKKVLSHMRSILEEVRTIHDEYTRSSSYKPGKHEKPFMPKETSGLHEKMIQVTKISYSLQVLEKFFSKLFFGRDELSEEEERVSVSVIEDDPMVIQLWEETANELSEDLCSSNPRALEYKPGDSNFRDPFKSNAITMLNTIERRKLKLLAESQVPDQHVHFNDWMEYHYFQIGIRKKIKITDLTIQFKLQPVYHLMVPLRKEMIIPN